MTHQSSYIFSFALVDSAHNEDQPLMRGLITPSTMVTTSS